MDRCTKTVGSIFGGLFLAAVIFVPCTVTRTVISLDTTSRVYIRKTIPRNTHLFLPSYLAARRASPGRKVEARTTQWVGYASLFAVLGVLEYFVFCRRRKRPRGRTSPEI
jgi:hypothetical protein